MRPIKLTISAFGPYAKETEIILDELGERGLYLITGDKMCIRDRTYTNPVESSCKVSGSDLYFHK